MAQPAPIDARYATQREMKLKTTTFIVLLALLYAAIFVPDAVVTWLKSRFGLLGSWAPLLGLPSLTGLMSLLIFTQDSLATGTSTGAQYFRSEYPTKFIEDHYACSQGDAVQLWFMLFGRWSDPNHAKHVDYVKTFERSYGCRFIFYVSRALVVFAAICALTLAVHYAAPPPPARPQVTAEAAAAIAAIVCASWLFYSNRIPSPRNANPTGCWWKWSETNGSHRAWLQHVVFQQAPTYADAIRIAPTL